ncbi:MAG: helix-turn-helix domain-containing protein [Rhodoferax sp.]|nr:helix-turn-helix domain-containing protein [Rhodoferax sp.]MDP3653749.1 helix-turn-helix domain-containing protein [Rhodoferax sp.]
MPLPASVLQAWRYTSTSTDSTVVLPDGCRDLILHVVPGQRPQWLLTALADTFYDVPGTVGECFWGFRLQPGAQFDDARLMRAVQAGPLHDAQDALPLLDACVRLDPRVVDALHSLSVSTTVATAARQLGVSERTLQRLVQAATGRHPAYWKCLARVRRATAGLSHAPSLVACAADHGFSDQAHMTREFQRWWGRTPSAVLASAGLLAVATASGYP